MKHTKVEEILNGVNSVIIGKEQIVKYCLVSFLAGGHVLLEDVPGVGKTTLAKAIAGVSGCDFGRIQFTPDTMPSDVTGVNIFHMETGQFEYMPGAVMHSVVLADEINRTSPKTQSSLLEAMEEGQVSVDGKTYPLAKPFFVIATQNHVDSLGTYHLPEAQLDRFLMKLSLGYPQNMEEEKMMGQFLHNTNWKEINAVSNAEELQEMQQQVREILVKDDILHYVQQILFQTRNSELVQLGASPRAGLALLRAAQALAYVDGKDFVTPDHIIELLAPVLSHRIVLSSEATIKKLPVEKVLSSLRLKVKVPVL